MAFCTVDDIGNLSGGDVFVGRVALGFATFVAIILVQVLRGRPNPWLAAGVGLMSIPAWHALLVTGPDILRTFCAQGDLNQVIIPGQTVPPIPRYNLSGQYVGAILFNVGHVTAGALLIWRGKDPEGWRSPAVARIAASLRGLLPMGLGEKRSLGIGVALFPLLVAANLLLLFLLPKTGDDSRVFDNITPLQVVLLALAAGVGEELVYRGVMQQGLKRLVPNRWAGLALAMAVQSIIFAYAHTGYKDLQHLQFAFYFAVLAGIVTEWLGIWAAIALHVLIDLAAFAGSVANPSSAFLATVAFAAVIILATSIYHVVLGFRALRRGRTI